MDNRWTTASVAVVGRSEGARRRHRRRADHVAGSSRCPRRLDLEMPSGCSTPAGNTRTSWRHTQSRRNVLAPAVAELQKISPQAWFVLRMSAHDNGMSLPSSPKQPHLSAPPSLAEHLAAAVEAADALGPLPRGRPPGVMLERAVAGAAASVFHHLRARPRRPRIPTSARRGLSRITIWCNLCSKAGISPAGRIGPRAGRRRTQSRPWKNH